MSVKRKLFETDSAGNSKPVNLAIEEVDGDMILFSDSKDFIVDDTHEKHEEMGFDSFEDEKRRSSPVIPLICKPPLFTACGNYSVLESDPNSNSLTVNDAPVYAYVDSDTVVSDDASMNAFLRSDVTFETDNIEGFYPPHGVENSPVVTPIHGNHICALGETIILNNSSMELVPYSLTSDESEKTPVKKKRKTRKRKRCIENWKVNVCAKQHRAGQQHVNNKGKLISKKVMQNKKDCTNCLFRCSEKICKEDRENIFLSFYDCHTHVEKQHFILKTTECSATKRSNKESTQKKKNNFSYFFFLGNEKVRVCKMFYLGTLAISQKSIYNAHLKKNNLTGTPAQDRRGESTKDKLTTETKDRVREHIKSFPKAESHYCRKSTSMEYLDPLLNISKMYDLYKDDCNSEKIMPVKLSMYRQIFNEEFNLSFLMPKSDLCDLCEEFRVAESENRLEPSLQTKRDMHIQQKEAMRNERQIDQMKNYAADGTIVVSFDLENVIALPKANVSNFFYKRKLNLYNMTAHISHNKKVYCAIWTEVMTGRSGNDIASAVHKILKVVLEDHPGVQHIVTWSDSCVPQNRNQMISLSMLKLLETTPQLKSIHMKYSTPGHSCIQDVDNVHSQIEKVMALSEFWSPVSFIRLLLRVNRRNPFRVIQLQPSHFLDFYSSSKHLMFKKVPFSKVAQLSFTKNSYQVSYKYTHSDKDFRSVDIHLQNMTRYKSLMTTSLENIRLAITKKSISKEKINDIQCMTKYMPQVDKAYYDSLLK